MISGKQGLRLGWNKKCGYDLERQNTLAKINGVLSCCPSKRPRKGGPPSSFLALLTDVAWMLFVTAGVLEEGHCPKIEVVGLW